MLAVKEFEMKKYLMVLLFLMFPVVCSAANISLNDVADALQNPFKTNVVQARGHDNSGIFDFQGDFFQQSQIAAIERVQRGRGFVSFRFDYQGGRQVPLAMFRWEYREPSQQEVVSNSKIMWVYLPENRQVILSDIQQVTQQRSDNPMTFLTGLGNLSRDFSVRWAIPDHDQDGNYVLELKPRRISSLIQSLQIVVDRRAVIDFVENNQVGNYFPILATTVVDPANNSTIIEFSNVRFNSGLSPLFFEFVRPAGVEVVRPTGSEMGF
jgi:outer membrane lipoprotein carrier protein